VFAGVRDESEPGRERVEEWRERESALEARRESAGEGGAGREEVRERSRDARNEVQEGDLGLPSDDFGASSAVVVVVVVEIRNKEGFAVVGHHRSGAGELCELRGGVEGETDVPPASSSGVDRVLELVLEAPSWDGWLASGASASPLLSNGTVGVVWPLTVASESGLLGSKA
jgi:hypothetical protein